MPIKKLVKPARKIAPVGGIKKKPVKAPAPDSDIKKKASSGGAFGQAAAEKKKQELERGKPFGLSIPVGGEATVYLLDKGEPFFHYEHNVGGGKGRRGKMYPCIKDSNESCPICSKEGKEGTFVMYLTCVVPKDTYTNKEGQTVTRFFQKKLFPIKTKMADKWRRIYEKHGTFRGLRVKLNRDGEFDPGTGNDVEVLGKLSEAKIKEYATGAHIKNAEAREQVKKAQIDKPFDYEKVFPKVTAKELAKMVNAAPSEAVGSEDVGDDDDFGTDDDWG